MRNLQTGDAPLAQVGEREIMRMIMDYPGVDVNIANFAGYTPLFEAMGNGHPEVVELMLNHEDTKLDIITYYVRWRECPPHSLLLKTCVLCEIFSQ